jgi:hypothetical protein
MICAVVLAASHLTACATSEPTIQTGPDAEVTFDGLYRVDNSRADAAWVRPEIDLSQYSKIRFSDVSIEYRPGGESGRGDYVRMRGSGPWEVTDSQKARLRELVNEVFAEELARSNRFELVDESGPDVLLVNAELLDVVSYVPPDPVGRSQVYLRRVGEATLVLELRDSVTNAILARSVDRRAAEQPGQTMTWSNTVSNTAEVRRLVRRWATSLREVLDALGG